jgi:hypothetical protein
LDLEGSDGDDVVLFNEDEGDAKKNGADMLECCSWFVTVVFATDAAAVEGGIDTLPTVPLVDVGIDTLPNVPLVDVEDPVLLEAVLLEAVLLEAVLLEAVLLEAVLLEAVLLEAVLLVVVVAVFSRWRFVVCASAETVARIPLFPVVAVA